MAKSYFILFFIFSFSVKAQEKIIFDTSRVDSETKLIGSYSHSDKTKKYKYLNFIIEDSAIIKKVLSDLVIGEDATRALQNPGFEITIVQNYEDAKSFIVNPDFNSILVDGNFYDFDLKKIKKLAQVYSFDFKLDKLIFENKIDYQQYFDRQKKDKTFLYAYAPTFKYEGSFEIRFPNDKNFSSPRAIINYLDPIISKITAKDGYTIVYILNEKNRNDLNGYTMTIKGNRKIFDELQLDNLKKENWTKTQEQAYFFYKVK